MQEERLNRFILRNLIEFEADDNPVASPIGEAPMKIPLFQPHSRPQHIVVEQ